MLRHRRWTVDWIGDPGGEHWRGGVHRTLCLRTGALRWGSAAPVEIVADRDKHGPRDQKRGRSMAAKASMARPARGGAARAMACCGRGVERSLRRVCRALPKKLTWIVSASLPRFQRPMRCHRHVTEAVLTMKQTGDLRKAKMSLQMQAGQA
jgi:hypothetical protein